MLFNGIVIEFANGAPKKCLIERYEEDPVNYGEA
jgi:hypothetical protein